jgi:putative oxidoreductase
MLSKFVDVYDGFFGAIERATEGWFIGLTARLTFASVLLVYFWNSALTKIGSGISGIFSPTIGAYAQILPGVAESYSYNIDTIPFLPYGLIVFLGTYTEFILPALIVVGLLTRLSALGMVVFIAVMTYIDINFLAADAKTIGAFFDRNPSSLIADQRLLWAFLLIVLVVKGPGFISVDALLGRLVGRAGN